jgi:hypothetical protein
VSDRSHGHASEALPADARERFEHSVADLADGIPSVEGTLNYAQVAENLWDAATAGRFRIQVCQVDEKGACLREFVYTTATNARTAAAILAGIAIELREVVAQKGI